MKNKMTNCTGDEIKQRRKNRGLTQEELAHLAGISWSTLQKIEGGKCKPHRSTLKLIDQALSTPNP